MASCGKGYGVEIFHGWHEYHLEGGNPSFGVLFVFSLPYTCTKYMLVYMFFSYGIKKFNLKGLKFSYIGIQNSFVIYIYIYNKIHIQ